MWDALRQHSLQTQTPPGGTPDGVLKEESERRDRQEQLTEEVKGRLKEEIERELQQIEGRQQAEFERLLRQGRNEPAAVPGQRPPPKSLLGRLLGIGSNETYRWPEANLRYDLGKGWIEIPTAIGKGLARTYYQDRNKRTVTVSFLPLATGETTAPEQIIKALGAGSVTAFSDAKPVAAEGRAKEWGLTLTEGNLNLGLGSKGRARLGRWIHRGGIYSLMVVTTGGKPVGAEFDRVLGRLAWLEPDKDVSVRPLDALRVAGAGLSVPCAGELLIAVPAELPFGVGASRLTSRLEVAGFAVKGMELPAREMVTAMLQSMAVGQGGNFRLEETKWAGLPACVARPKADAKAAEREVDWRLTGTVRDGWFCVAFASWPASEKGFPETSAALVAKAQFTPPAGEAPAIVEPAHQQYAATVYNNLGLLAFGSGRYQAAAGAFARSVELWRKDPVVVANLVNALSEQGRFRQALEALEQHGKPFPEDKGLRQWRASLLAESGRPAEAVEIYEGLFKGGLRDQTALLQWIGALQSLERHERAVEVARTVYEEGHQLQWQRMLANCLWAAGRLEEARGHFRELARELGGEERFAADHASLLLEMNDCKAVLELVAAWEKEREAPVAMLFTKGMAQSGLGWFKDAVATFTRVDEKSPGNQTVKEALARAQAMLGRGSLEGYREELEPVPLPPAIAARAAAAEQATPLGEKFPGEGWVTLHDLRVWEWHEGKDAKATDYRRIRVLESSGVAAFATIYLAFKPNTERIKVHRLTVTDAGGRELAAFRKEEMYVRDEGGEVAAGGKVLCLPVPALKEGALIELVTSKVLLGTAERFPLAAGGIRETGAMVYGAVVFTGDLGQLRFAHNDRLTPAAGEGWRAYEASCVSRLRAAGDLPPADRWGLLCWAGDRRRTWESEATEYLGEIRDCLADDGFAEGVVRDLALAGKPPQEMVRIVVRWLNRKFQYQGLEFGRRARIPAKGALTLSRGFGDCKDLSVMVRGVLRKAGVTAELALVGTSGVLREEIPDLDQFDHMVVYLPELGGAILDPTVRHFNSPEALPAHLTGVRALLFEGPAPRFVAMREPSAAPRTMELDREVRPDAATGDSSCRETVVFSPARGVAMRYVFSTTPGAEQVRTMESLLRGKEPGIEVKSVRFHDLDDPFKPLRLELEYRVPGAFHPENGGLTGSIPAPIERLFLESVPERGRNVGILVRCQETTTARSRVLPPDGFAWQPPAETERRAAEPGALEGTATWRQEPGEVVFTGTLKTMPCEGDADLCRRIHSANEATFRLWSERLRFVRKP
jgi:transglutaminase-like putative cysteine protease